MVGEILLGLPLMFKLVKLILRCCGGPGDQAIPLWWRRRLPLRAPETSPSRAEEAESVPLRPMRRVNRDDYFVNLARDAGALTLEEFVERYNGDLGDLRRFHEQVNGSSRGIPAMVAGCLLYTSDAADE